MPTVSGTSIQVWRMLRIGVRSTQPACSNEREVTPITTARTRMRHSESASQTPRVLGGSRFRTLRTLVCWPSPYAAAPPMKARTDRASLAISSVHKKAVSKQLRATTLANTAPSSPSSATHSTVWAVALTARMTAPAAVAGSTGNAAAAGSALMAGSALSFSGLHRLLHLVHQIGTDLVAELGVDRVHGGMEGGIVGRVDLQALRLAERLGFRRLLRDETAPLRLDLDRGFADGLLKGRVERVELALARHQLARVIDVVGQPDILGDLVHLGRLDGDQGQFQAGNGLLRNAEIDLGDIHHHRDRADRLECSGEDGAGLDADLQPLEVGGFTDRLAGGLGGAPAVMAPDEAIDALCRHVGQQVLADRAIEQRFRALGVLEQERQVEDLHLREEGLEEAGGMECHVDDAGLHARDKVCFAAQLTAGEHADFHRTAGLLGDDVGKLQRHGLHRMQRGVRVAQLERDG